MLLKKVVLLAFMLVLFVNLASAQYYYDQGFGGYGFFGLGGIDDILLIYESFSGWFDFFIFFIIFLGLTQVVFGEGHFRKQGKTLSIGISLALSFGIVLWERNNNLNLLAFGPVAFLIFYLLLGFTVFSILRKVGQSGWSAGAWTYVVLFITLMLFGNSFLSPLVQYAGGLFQLLNLLFWVCILIGIIGFFVGQERPQPRGNP